MIRELDTVVLIHDIKEHGLRQDDVGAVVHVYKNNTAFEVDLVTGEGETVALLALTQEDIRPMRPKEILSVRQFA